MSNVTIGVLAEVVLAVSSCGGDDDASNGADDAGGAAESADDGDAGGVAGGEAAGGEDLVAGMMATFFGEAMVDVLSDEERDCVNDVLAPSFPQGLPPGLAATDEFGGLLDAPNTAAEACDVTL